MKRSKSMLVLGMIVMMAIALLCSPRTYAQGTYRWADEKGNMHFADDRGGVPQKEWSKMKQDSPGVGQDRREIQGDKEKIRADRKAPAGAEKSGDKGKIEQEQKDLRERDRDALKLNADERKRRGIVGK